MVYAEMIIKVYVDESKLTKEQQDQAEKADSNLSEVYPLEQGIADLRCAVENIASNYFEYLGEGAKAVTIEI